MEQEVEIRPARTEDVPALADLARRTWADAFGHSVTPDELAAELAETRSEARFERAIDERTILVAVIDGVLVGYAELSDGELNRLYVKTALQGRGLGRALAEAALADPRLAGADRVRLQVWEENTRAMRLYESLGFRVVGTTTISIGGGEPVEDLVMELLR